MSTILTATELQELTGKRQHCAQARVLKSMGIPNRCRPDGSLVVGRDAVATTLATPQSHTRNRRNASANDAGITWSSRAS